MRSALFAAVAAVALLSAPPLMFSIASEHCARYAKTAHITSVHRVYGDYIGFRCRRGPLLPEPVVYPPWVLWPWFKP